MIAAQAKEAQGLSKGERTRQAIVEQVAPLFNKHGYAGVSMADIMAATGLEKGGIYRHFDSKEALAVAAFDYAIDLINQRIGHAVQAATTTVDQLYALLDTVCCMADHPVVEGGCPILNAAVEHDDSNHPLAERVRQTVQQWRATVVGIVTQGVMCRQVHAEVDPEKVAAFVIATMEGANFLSNLYKDTATMHHVVFILKPLLAKELSEPHALKRDG